MIRYTALTALLLLVFACQQPQSQYRMATFNIWEMSMEKLNDMDDSGRGQNPQLVAAAEIIQEVRPDILVINEIDHVYGQFDADLTGPAHQFIRAYLNQGDEAIDYPYVFAAPCNTGIPSGRDLNGDGYTAKMGDERSAQYAADCFGWGEYAGQYSMVLLSRFPIDEGRVRTFQNYLWKDLPGHHMPLEYYGDNADVLRLSSKSHWDVPVTIGEHELHVLMSHPTPPGFDGEEDRNGRRNFDELKLWVHYLENDGALKDDQGADGGFSGQSFVFAGDFNADPSVEAVYDGVTAIGQLLNHPKVQDSSQWLTSKGGVRGLVPGPPRHAERFTVQFGQDNRMRIDYLLPSHDLKIEKGGVYWPSPEENAQGFERAEKASDHRLIWLDMSWK